MKKLFLVAAAVIIAAAAFAAGRAAGIRYTIENMEIWAVERYNPDAPEESAWNGYDLRVLVDLDGQTWEHGCTVY